MTTRGQVTGPVEPCWSSRARSTGSKRPPRAWPTVEPIGQAIGGRPKAGVVLRCPQSRCTARLQSFREQHPPVAAQLHGSAFLIQLQPSLRHGVVEKPVTPAGLCTRRPLSTASAGRKAWAAQTIRVEPMARRSPRSRASPDRTMALSRRACDALALPCPTGPM